MPGLESVLRDVLYALRSLRKNPAFAATAVLILALGIGGNTAIFTVVRAVLLKPLAYEDPDRLVRLGDMTPVRYEETRAAARSFTAVGAYAVVPEHFTLSGGAQPEALKGARVSANFLAILGVRPALGRPFLPEEDKPGAHPVAMISTELWRRRFGADPFVTGRSAAFDTTPFTIIGVLPAGFEFPFAGIDVWVAQPSEVSIIPPQARRRSGILTGFARLQPGVTLSQAGAELDVIHRQYARAHPGMIDAKPKNMARLAPLKDGLVANVRSMLWMLFGAVGFVLLIACANVAGLLLARAASHSRELAVRAALGAGRASLIRQLLAESALLGAAGGVLGILFAEICLRVVTGMSAFHLPRAGEIRMDSGVLWFTVILSLGTGLLFGLIPSLAASRPDLAGILRAGDERTGGIATHPGRTGVSARAVLVTGQVALSIVLLIGAALMMESLARLNGVDPGFQPANLLSMQISLPPARYDTLPKRGAFYDELLRRAAAIPGVSSTALAFTLPMTSWSGSPIQVVGQPPVKFSERPIGRLQVASPDFFRTFEIALRRGRVFTSRDGPDAPQVAIVNEAFARRFWPAYPHGPSPIGQRILIGSLSGPVEIVGVVADVHDLDAGARPEIYRPSGQTAPQSAVLVARTDGNPRSFTRVLRAQVLAIDPDQAVTAVRTMDDVVEASLGPRRLTMALLAAFAGVALLLAIVGIYGVISYSVAQRTQEIGIRRALGAQRGEILRLLLGQGLMLAVAGVAVGIIGALALTRVMKSLLFDVSATDPGTFAGIAVLFLAAALAAGYVPARRAMRIDPMAALRGR